MTDCTRATAALVKQECDNFDGHECTFGGQCPVLAGKPCKIKFMTAVVDGGLYHFPDGYDYFSACLVPLAVTHKPEHLRGAQDYLAMIGGKAPEARKCACGTTLAKAKQMCPSCAKKARRLSRQKSKAQGRQKFKNQAIQPLV